MVCVCVCEWMDRSSLCCRFFVHRLLKRPIGTVKALRFYPPVFQSNGLSAVWPVCLCSKRAIRGLCIGDYNVALLSVYKLHTLQLFPFTQSTRCEMLPSVQKSVCVDSVGWCFETQGHCDSVCQLCYFICCCWKRTSDLFFYCSKSIWTVCVGALSRLLPSSVFFFFFKFVLPLEDVVLWMNVFQNKLCIIVHLITRAWVSRSEMGHSSPFRICLLSRGQILGCVWPCTKLTVSGC